MLKRAIRAPWVGYVVPMATFLVLTTLEGWFPQAFYPGLYGFKIICVTALLCFFHRPLRDIQIQKAGVLLAFGVGLLVFAEWVWLTEWLQQWLPFIVLGERTGFDPLTQLQGWSRYVFIGMRLYGLVLVVPVMEELFWRSFLLRYFSDPEFTTVPMGDFTGQAFGIVALTFGLAHSEWFAAVLCGVMYALLLKVTRSLWACIVAHAITNLALGVYILITQTWSYW